MIEVQPRQRWMITQMQCMVPMVALGLRLFGLKRTWRLLDFLAVAPKSPPHPQAQVQQALFALKYAMAHTPWSGNCLSRSLVLWWQLGRQGIESELRIGVGSHNSFRAHAWVECEGRPLNAGKMVHQRYQVFEQFDVRQLEDS